MKQLIVIFTYLALLSLVSCGSSIDSLIEMGYAETHCADPWMTGSGSDDSEVEIAVTKYFQDLGIEVSDVVFVFDGPLVNCLACDCISSRTIYLKVADIHLSAMEDEGFTKS